MNSVHIDDVVAAMWAVALWMEPLGRAKADELASEIISYYSPEKESLFDGLEGHVAKDRQVAAPFFNLVSRSSYAGPAAV